MEKTKVIVDTCFLQKLAPEEKHVGNVSKTGCTLYQFNQAGAACNMGYYAFGY